jgi:hypothetical protein
VPERPKAGGWGEKRTREREREKRGHRMDEKGDTAAGVV